MIFTSFVLTHSTNKQYFDLAYKDPLETNYSDFHENTRRQKYKLPENANQNIL